MNKNESSMPIQSTVFNPIFQYRLNFCQLSLKSLYIILSSTRDPKLLENLLLKSYIDHPTRNTSTASPGCPSVRIGEEDRIEGAQPKVKRERASCFVRLVFGLPKWKQKKKTKKTFWKRACRRSANIESLVVALVSLLGASGKRVAAALFPVCCLAVPGFLASPSEGLLPTL
ncbi:hypothetical protein L596_015871 [Steinernema carpocapsae]|uniref:Uncharacterized protein n=1 Tax=Steinernema carpocapsae TaxID=34508 RepID=A0A4U5NGE7_STECR|nr:hypothetical protein L596_015871 [Steinernema carpocapsae]